MSIGFSRRIRIIRTWTGSNGERITSQIHPNFALAGFRLRENVDADGKPVKARGIAGKFTLDRAFDGQKDTTPEGIIYIVTEAGGQRLYNPEQQDDTDSWQEFTTRHISKVHSLTVADIVGRTLMIRQVTPDGEEVDRFTVTK